MQYSFRGRDHIEREERWLYITKIFEAYAHLFMLVQLVFVAICQKITPA